MDNYIGKMLDNRYEILEVIGIGGMAVVYKALCHRLNRLVAIKILKDEFSQDAEFRRRFHAESQAVAMLSHPNIVSVYDVSHSGDTDYIVMELIDGITLKQYMEQKGQLNWRESLHFATQIAKALAHAHSRGIFHRDIMPHNIMILKFGSVKVADFGIARITSAQSTLTREALGSVHYISPEQARGSRVDKRTDIYSLGVVMYEMLTGRPPFDGDSPVAVAIQHINGTPVLPRELNPNIPKGLEQITMHAMTASLDQRYESATDLLADLEEFRKNPNVVFDFTAPSLSDRTQVMEPVRAEPRQMADRSTTRNPPTRPPEPRRTERAPEPPAPKGNRVAVIAGVVCILLAAVGIFAFLYNTFLRDLLTPTEDVTVPQFVDQTYDSVMNNTAYDNLTLEATWVTDDAAYGTIIGQSPAAYSTVKEGATVELTVSSGPEVQETVAMPSLVGQTLSYAETSLGNLSVYVSIQVERVDDDTVPEDQIISTDPVAGQALQEGQAVILTVSNGPAVEPVQVPELVGLNIDDALARLEEMGLDRGSVSYQTNELPEGTVFFQSIDQGTEVNPGTVINLLVSRGPDEEVPPDEEQPPEEQQPDDSDQGSGETTGDGSSSGDGDTGETTPTETMATIDVLLPTDRETTVVTVTVDGVPQGEPMEVSTSLGSIQLQVWGTGSQTVAVYFDSVEAWSDLITFGEGR